MLRIRPSIFIAKLLCIPTLFFVGTAKPSPLECQLKEAGRENDSQEADAANKQPVWWSHETLCHLRQVLGKMNVKTARMVHNYMSCFPHRASQVLPLIKHSRVHCTQLCIIHQAFLSIRFNISSSHTTSLFPSSTPSSVLVYSTRTIGISRSMALRIVAAFLLPRGLAEKCGYGCGDNFSEKFRQPPHNIVVKHFDRRVVRRDESTGALVHSADFANTYYHPSPVHIMRKKPVFDGRVHIDLSTYHSLDEDQREGSAERLWTDCEYHLIRNNVTSTDFY